MARPPSKTPTELELDILKVLWERGPLPVRDVQQALEPDRPLAYTSVMTMMTIMVDKGYLARRKQQGRFVYRARIRQADTRRSMLRDVVQRAFDGSTAAAALHLVNSGDLTPEQIAELRTILDDKQKRSPRED
jgi:predicted transcriptional regulator